MAHVRSPYWITLIFGTLAAAIVAGCGGDASQRDLTALREEVAQLKLAQTQLQASLESLQTAVNKAASTKPGDGSAEPGDGSTEPDDAPGDTDAPPAAPTAPPAAAARTDEEPVVEIPLEGAPSKGPEGAPVTVVEFADFQCPFCKANVGLSDQLMKKFPGGVRFVFKHYPIGKHKSAQEAARAAWAAQQQGKFWEMHDLLYASEEMTFTPELLRGFAEQIGLDMTRFDADYTSARSAFAVSFDKKLGKQLRVHGTPTYFVNGKRVPSASIPAAMAKVKQALAEQRQGAAR